MMNKLPKLGEKRDPKRFFSADDYVLVGKAHSMVEELVTREGPYREKLLDLAKTSIKYVKAKGAKVQYTASDIVELAWNGFDYYWPIRDDERITEDSATAFVSKGSKKCGSKGKESFLFIAISSSFRKHEQTILDTALENRVLLLFFRKIKHGFLHVVLRYLGTVHFPKEFQTNATPQKYIPQMQIDQSNPEPDVGDHDEEEDSGGSILPLYNDKMLSDSNPLCLHLDGEFLALSDSQVEGLLDLELYFEEVRFEGEPHNEGLWTALFSRAFVKNILTREFVVDTSNKVPSRKSNSDKRRREILSTHCSSPTGLKTPKANRTNPPLWRTLGNIAIERKYSSDLAIVSQPTTPDQSDIDM